MKTIDDFIEEVTKCYASLIAYGRWADRSPYSEDEAWSKAFLGTAQTYRKEVKTDVHLRDTTVVAGRGRRDEAVQVLDKEGQMREGQPMEQSPADRDKAFSDRCVILLIRLVAQLKMVHQSPEYLNVWRYWTMAFGPYAGPSYAPQFDEALAHVEWKFDKPVLSSYLKQIESISDLIKTWHGRFLNVINVVDNSLHSGGFPVMGEVYHRREVTDKVSTFDLAFEQLRHKLLNKENFEGDTLYIRVAPTIEKVYDFESTKDVYCGIARFSYTVRLGTVVIDKDKFMQK